VSRFYPTTSSVAHVCPPQSPWCGHCKVLAPEWSLAAKALKSHSPPITLAKLDASQSDNKPIASIYGVRGFPTIKLFRKGEPTEYKGPRTSAGIVEYLMVNYFLHLAHSFSDRFNSARRRAFLRLSRSGPRESSKRYKVRASRCSLASSRRGLQKRPSFSPQLSL
jgi:protein disulfide-isomerase-like protein